MLGTMCSIDKETGLIDRLTQTSYVEENKKFSFDFDKEGYFFLFDGWATNARVTMFKNVDSTSSLIQAGDTSQTTSCWIQEITKNSCD